MSASETELNISGSVQHWIWHTPVNGWESGIHIITYPSFVNAPFSAWIFAEDMRLYDTRSWANTSFSAAHFVLNLSGKLKLRQNNYDIRTGIGFPIPVNYSPYTVDLSDGRSTETGVTTRGINFLLNLPNTRTGFAALPFGKNETAFAFFIQKEVFKTNLKFSVADFFAASYFHDELILAGQYNDLTYALEGSGQFNNGIKYSFDYANQHAVFLADINKKFRNNTSARKLELSNITLPTGLLRMNLTCWNFDPGFSPRMHNRYHTGPLFELKERKGFKMVLTDQQGKGRLEYKNYLQQDEGWQLQNWVFTDKRNLKGMELVSEYSLINRKEETSSGVSTQQSDLITVSVTKPFALGRLKFEIGKQRGNILESTKSWQSGFDLASTGSFIINKLDLNIIVPKIILQNSTLNIIYAQKFDLLEREIFAEQLRLSFTHRTATNSSLSLNYRKTNPSNDQYSSTLRPSIVLGKMDNFIYLNYQRGY